MTGASDSEARAFAAAFRSFLEWVHSGQEADWERNEVVRLVRDFLGEGALDRSVVGRTLPAFEHVNLQTALNAWSQEPGREVAVHGISIPPRHGTVSLQQLITGEAMPPLRLSAPPLVDLPNGPGSTLACLKLGVLLVSDADGRYVVMVSGQHEHDPALGVEIAGLPVKAAQGVHARLGDLRSELNVYRGQVVEVTATPMGVSLDFGEIPLTARDDVVLPEATLARVERHALDVAAHREALLQAGQHLKRGVLLYGPPGTGKTHTTRYLIGEMTRYTRLVLTGRSLHAIGSVADLARELQPSVIVLEDVDLVAEDRSFGPSGSSPVLFDLLDAMDGAAADADLLFLLTTNRADLLEPALAARPGRVDIAIEIALPDADARQRLLALYARSLPMRLNEDETREVVERTEGVTASFIKELLRRAMLESLHEGASAVTAAHTSRALDDLLDSGQQLTRSLLGVGNDPETLPPGGGLGSLAPQRGRVWGHPRSHRI